MLTHDQIMRLFYADGQATRYNIPCIFVRDGYECATDGRMAIRRKTDKPSDGGGFATFHDVFKGHPIASALVSEIADPGVPDVVVGNATDCEKCHGCGEIECDECGHTNDCKQCDGRGYTGRKDESPERLPVKIGDAWFNADYIAALWAIGVREVRTTLANKPLYFELGEYQGLVMPIHREESFTHNPNTPAILRIRKILHEYAAAV